MSDSTEHSAQPGRRPEHKRRGSRFRARRRAADILFEAEARDYDPVALVEERIELARGPHPDVAPVAEYTRQIVAGAAVEIDLIDEAISRFLVEEWAFERLPSVERAIMRVAVWELLFNPDVPAVAAIDEAVRLTGDYSDPSAQSYVNAILDAVAAHASELRAGTPEPDAPEFMDAADTEADTEEDAPVSSELRDDIAGGADTLPAAESAPAVVDTPTDGALSVLDADAHGVGDGSVPDNEPAATAEPSAQTDTAH